LSLGVSQAILGFHAQTLEIFEACDIGFPLRISAIERANSVDFPEKDGWRASADDLQAAVSRDQAPATFPKTSLFGNVWVGSALRSLQDGNFKNFEGLSVEPRKRLMRPTP
jgi:hypothetical protein